MCVPLSNQSFHTLEDGTMEPYFSDRGPESGRVRYRDVDGMIDVFGDPGRSICIGQARCIGWDAAGSAVWRLSVGDEEDDGRWVIVDGEFQPAETGRGELYSADGPHDSAFRRRGSRTRRGARPGQSGRADRPSSQAVEGR